MRIHTTGRRRRDRRWPAAGTGRRIRPLPGGGGGPAGADRRYPIGDRPRDRRGGGGHRDDL